MSKKELASIVGSEQVFDDAKTLDAYPRDQSFVPSSKPLFVVKPKNTAEVCAIVQWANQTTTPLVPVSSGPPHFRGDTIPSTGGQLL